MKLRFVFRIAVPVQPVSRRPWASAHHHSAFCLERLGLDLKFPWKSRPCEP